VGARRLRRRLDVDGYLLLRGFLPRAAVAAAHEVVAAQLEQLQWSVEGEGPCCSSSPNLSAGVSIKQPVDHTYHVTTCDRMSALLASRLVPGTPPLECRADPAGFPHPSAGSVGTIPGTQPRAR
jgi:hypothetical protein